MATREDLEIMYESKEKTGVRCCTEKDFGFYSGVVRKKFLAPVFLENETYTVYKSLGFPGLTPPHYILALNEYQGYKFNQDAFASPFHQQIIKKERRSSKRVIRKERSKSHSNTSAYVNQSSARQRRHTSHEHMGKEAGSSLSHEGLFSLLSIRNTNRATFKVLAGLIQDFEEHSRNENAIEEEEEDDEINPNLEDNIHGITHEGSPDGPDNMEQDEDETYEGLGREEEDDELEWDDEEGSSEEEDAYSFVQQNGLLYHKVPVIDIIVSDDDDDQMDLVSQS